jgi:hypothetical protein
MVSDTFGVILEDLGKEIGLTGLQPDGNNSCLLNMKEGVSIQIEPDASGNFLVLGAKLGVVPPGKYRENLFKAALKANDLPHPINGVLSYSKKADQLVLYKKIPSRELTGGKLATEIKPFVEKAVVWQQALAHNDVPEVNQVYTSRTSGSGIFGL